MSRMLECEGFGSVRERIGRWAVPAAGIQSVPAANSLRQASSKATDVMLGMRSLPSDVIKYSQVPASGKCFTADKIPKGLLKQHTTKEGTWGVIDVQKGTLEYKILEPAEQVFALKAPAKGIIEPTVLHQVKALTDDLEFVVEFHRLPDTGPVEEEREGL
eukprot:gene13940-19876_t